MGYSKIIGGEYKGRKILVPNGVRALPGIFRKRIFDILKGYLENVSVLDLFAGSGSFGIEALSRGAQMVTFVESNRRVISFLKRNCEFACEKNVRIIPADVFVFIRGDDPYKYDIIFADPPFLKGYGNRLLYDPELLFSRLNPGGLFLLRLHKMEPLDNRLFKKSVELGEGILYIYEQ